MKWAALVKPQDRPAILNKKHTDFIWPLKYIPRAWNAFFGDIPPAVYENKHQRHYGRERDYEIGPWAASSPIPAPGEWVLRFWPWPYFAFQTKKGWMFRIGFRWDDVDGYYDLGVTIKREK